jgi:hypothetical protein
MKSNSPSSARVVAEISIDQAVSAIEHFAANFPADRCSTYISRRLFAAAAVIQRKADLARKLLEESTATKSVTKTVIGTMPVADPYFSVGGCLSGRIDSSKENPCFGNREMAAEGALDKLRRLAARVAPASDSTGYAEPEDNLEGELWPAVSR